MISRGETGGVLRKEGGESGGVSGLARLGTSPSSKERLKLSADK